MKLTPGRFRGAVMSEFVLILPLLVVIFALLLYFGRLMVRLEHASVMTRYETWRDVQRAPGPRSDHPNGNPLLNQSFFNGNADQLGNVTYNNYFPDEPYDQWVDSSANVSADAGRLADAVLYRSGGEHRYSRGIHQAFSLFHNDTASDWDRLIGGRDIQNPERASPMTRRHTRIGSDWSYTNDWRASHPHWADTWGVDPHHPRGVRDAFLADVDARLDSIDGSNSSEYGDSREPQEPADSLAGLVRTLYLSAPRYAGPTVR